MDKIIEIKNFSKKFGNQQAVDNLSFNVNKGDIFAFLGANGSGKTTTIRCLLDIYKPDSGQLLIEGKPYHFSMSKKIGYLPEERGIYTRSKVIDLFMYFARLRGINKEIANKSALDYLERVGLSAHITKEVSQLSSGMQQKVQVGLALQHKPEILILDEPFKGLDPVNRQLYIEIFKELKENGVTIIYSTHVIDDAQKLTDRLVIIKNGKRIAYGATSEVREANGKKVIHIEYTGKLINNDKLYIASTTNKTAELSPQKGISNDEILKFLIDSKIGLISFKVDYPSLNEVFISLTNRN